MERTDSFTTPTTFSRKKVSCVPSLVAAVSSSDNFFSTMNGAIVSKTVAVDSHCAVSSDKPIVDGVRSTGGGGEWSDREWNSYQIQIGCV